MGILDDAIREHLELKRSHGASDDEISRQEAEVFGAVRQEAVAPAAPEGALDEPTQLLAPDDAAGLTEPDAASPVVPDATAPAEPEAPLPVEHDVAELEPLEPAPEDPYEVHPGDSLVPDPEQPPHHDHHHDEPHPALIDHDHIGGEEHAPEPVFGHRASEPPVAEPPVAEPPPPPAEEPITEPHAIEDAGEDEEADEDVLEETPEFLQDAPEHDRLWFEQKPPRDFDFGE